MLEISGRPLPGAGHRRDGDARRDVGPRVGDELLRTVHHPLVAVELGPGLGVAGVRSGLGLGQAEGRELLPGRQLGHPLLLLLLGAPHVDGHRPERRVGGHRDRHRGVDPGQLLDREGVGHGVRAAAAVLLGEGDPHKAELAHLRDELIGKGLGAVELLGDRRHFPAGEVAHGVAEQALLVCELEVHRFSGRSYGQLGGAALELRSAGFSPGPSVATDSRTVSSLPHFSQTRRSLMTPPHSPLWRRIMGAPPGRGT